MKRLLALLALVILSFAAWRWNAERLAAARACEILSSFQQERLYVSEEESVALHALAEESYAVRKAALEDLYTGRCPSTAYIHLPSVYIAATRLDVATLRRFTRDLEHGDSPNLNYETDASTALGWYASHSPSRGESGWAESNWLDAVKLLAARCPIVGCGTDSLPS